MATPLTGWSATIELIFDPSFAVQIDMRIAQTDRLRHRW